jgi:hypothetical protein
MKLSEAFPSNFLKSEDLGDRDVPVIISTADMDMVGNERKLILTFQGKKKSMICNKTNAGRIAYMYGDDTDGWIGKEIMLTSEFVEYQGKTVKGLRIKPPPKRQQDRVPDTISSGIDERSPQPPARRAAPADLDDEIPF